MTINVLHLTSTPRGIGGVEQLLLDAARVFGKQEISVSFANVFAEDDAGPFPTAMNALGVPFGNIAGKGIASIPGVLTQLVRLLRAWKIDMVHMHMFHATVIGTIAARMARVPVSVVTRHYLESGYAHRTRFAQQLDMVAARSATHIVAVSRAVYSDLVGRVGISPERVTVIPNGVSAARLSNAGPLESRPVRSGECVLCTVGSLVPWKGHADLITAFALALKRDHSLRLLIVGDGPERGALEQLARDLGVADRVTFAGFRTDVPAILRSADIYVHAALDEALGVAILEAMAAGKPVIATAVGGVLDIIPDAAVGLLVPPANPAAMADAIQHLSAEPGQRHQMSRRGRQHVIDNFSIESVVSRYETLYETLAAGSPPGQARARAYA